MSNEAHISMTPPLTPPAEFKGVADDFDSDSLDYMDFFNGELDQVSPTKEIEVPDRISDNGLMSFSCKGDVRWHDSLTDTACLGKKSLWNLLQHKNPCSSSPASIASDMVFYMPCSPDNIEYNLEHYFLSIRQCITELERGAQSSLCLTQSCHDVQYPKLREDVAKFFNSLISYIHDTGNDGSEEFLKTVIAELLDLLLFLGPLYNLKEHVTSAGSPRGNKCSSAAYHLFHLHLDIRWWSLMLLHIIQSTWGSLSLPTSHPRVSPVLVCEPQIAPNGGMADSDQQTVFEQCISLVIWDLITIMCHEGLKKSVSDLHQLQGFSCSCSQELGVMVLHLLDHRHAVLGKESFWEHIKNKLLMLLKLYSESAGMSSASSLSESRFDVIQFPPPITKGVKIPHVWWIFTNFSKLYGYDCVGKLVPPKSAEIKSETKLLRTLVKLSFGDPKGSEPVTEVELRFFLKCCLSLHHLWGGERSSEWASLLWDYFSKHLDSSFLLPGAGLEGLACISKTAGGWLEQVKSRLPDPELEGKSETSWQIFLRIVVGVVQSGHTEWRQMKGRIYSKFHGRKMLELSPVGLYNSITLFLTLGNTIDVIDVTSKLCELLMMAPVSSVSKSKVIWRGFLATVLLLVESGCDILPVSQKFTSVVGSLCQEYIVSRDAIHKRDMGQLFIIYAEGVQEVFEQSNDLSLSQHSLICSGLSSVLQHCGISEMKAVLTAVSAALNKVLRNSEKLHCLTGRVGMDIVETVWKEFGSFIKSQATTLTPPSILGSVAAMLTLCLAQHSQGSLDGLNESAAGVLVYFLNNEAVNTLSSVQYASSLLSEPGSINKISQACPSYETHFISCWLSALVTQGDSEELISLTPLVTSLPGVVAVLHQPPACPFEAAQAFVMGVSRKFANIDNFGERMAYRDTAIQYFSTLDKAYGCLLKKIPSPNYLSSAMEFFGCLIYHCHSVIYIKSRPTCPLPSLISTVVLPTNVYGSEKPLNPTLSAALAHNIPKIVGGLGSLSLSQDPYLIRCVRDLFTQYMHRFPVKTSKNYSTVTHPFIMCLHNGDIRENNLQELRMVFLEVVKDSYLGKRGLSNLHYQMVISLLLELMSRSSSEWVYNISSHLLFPLLELLLVIDDQVTKRSATDLLQNILEEAQKQNSPSRGELVEIIRKFVMHHVSWSSHRLFRVLGVIGVINRPLIVDCLPHIAHAVRTTEEKRGTGLDHTLRQGYQNLLARMGINDDDIQDNR